MNVKNKTLLLLLLACLLLFSNKVTIFAQTSCESTCDRNSADYETCLNNVEGLCKVKVDTLKTQANTLANQVAQFNAQIQLTTLKISQTQEQIKLLGGRIDQLETSLGSLSDAFSGRAVETYKMSRSNEPIFLLLNAKDLSDVIASFDYLKRIQEADRNLMIRLQKAQNIYVDQKSQQEDLARQLSQQQAQLNSQKAAKANLLTATKNDEAKFQALLIQAQNELSFFRGFALGKTSIVPNQTVCDSWGCYYAQGDPNWGKMPLGNSSDTVESSGCLITSSAMVATHYGKNLNPADMAQTPSADWLLFDVTVKGVEIVRNSVSPTTANIDSELSQGRPVIVGLFLGCYTDINGQQHCFPKHFIVLKSGSDGNYTMYDPLGKANGYNVPFTNVYKLSDITDVEYVTVQ